MGVDRESVISGWAILAFRDTFPHAQGRSHRLVPWHQGWTRVQTRFQFNLLTLQMLKPRHSCRNTRQGGGIGRGALGLKSRPPTPPGLACMGLLRGRRL